MQEILQKIPDFIQLFALLGMVLTILATIIVRLTPSKVDDEKVDAFALKIMKALSWLPTIGINPRTQALEQAYKELKEKQDAPKSN